MEKTRWTITSPTITRAGGISNLPRPQTDSIDYTRVSNLLFYYNGLPAGTTVSCGIDDVRALMKLDQRSIADPYVEIDGHRLTAQGEIHEGEYLFAWPGESARHYRAGHDGSPSSTAPLPTMQLSAGTHQVRFGCQDQLSMPIRVRLTLQPAERHEMP